MVGANSDIDAFLSAPSFGVAGASEVTYKFGYKCFQCLIQSGRKSYPVNPNVTSVLGEKAYPDLASLPEPVQSVSIITPPAVTEQIVADAIKCGVKNIWMQPGADSPAAVQAAQEAGMNVIYGGPCLLVVLSYFDL